MVAEAEETERLRAELDRAREDAERLLAAERAEVARLREELLNSEVPDGAPDEASRRMVERMHRDLDRERARRARCAASSRSCARSPPRSARSHSNGTLAGEDPTVPGRDPRGPPRRRSARAARPLRGPAAAPPRAVLASEPGRALGRALASRLVLIVAMAVALVYLVQQVMP